MAEAHLSELLPDANLSLDPNLPPALLSVAKAAPS